MLLLTRRGRGTRCGRFRLHFARCGTTTTRSSCGRGAQSENLEAEAKKDECRVSKAAVKSRVNSKKKLPLHVITLRNIRAVEKLFADYGKK